VRVYDTTHAGVKHLRSERKRVDQMFEGVRRVLALVEPWNWVDRVRARRTVDRELADEIAEHLAQRTEELVSRGASMTDARRQAVRDFGNVTLITERSRDVWRFALIENMWRDLHYAWRQLRRAPAFALAAVFTLALAIGANAAMFAVVERVVLNLLPYPESDRLVVIDHGAERLNLLSGLNFTPGLYYHYAERASDARWHRPLQRGRTDAHGRWTAGAHSGRPRDANARIGPACVRRQSVDG